MIAFRPPHHPSPRGGPRTAPACPRRGGFTLVEMLVVIAIIALLLGVLLVGLRGVFGSAGKTRELSNLRQVYLAWTMYSSANNEAILPGYLDGNTQDRWNVSYRDARGDTVPAADAAGWPWRLAAYTDYSWEAMVGYRQDFTEDLAEVPVTEVASEPAYAYNAYYVGGWWETPDIDGPSFVRFDDLPAPFNAGIIARTQGGIARPESQIVFSTSTQRGPGYYKNNDTDLTPGSHWVVPPFLGATEIWQVGIGGSPTIQVLSAESVPLPRYNATFATLVADGGTSTEALEALADMRRWVNAADKRDWTHP